MAGTSTTNELGVCAVCCYAYGQDCLLGITDLGKGQFTYLLAVPTEDLAIIASDYSAGKQELACARSYYTIIKDLLYKQRAMFRDGETEWRATEQRSEEWYAAGRKALAERQAARR